MILYATATLKISIWKFSLSLWTLSIFHLSPLTLMVIRAPQVTLPFHLSLSSATLGISIPIPVHSLMLSSHLFCYLARLLAPFTFSCRIVFVMPEDLEMWPYHLCFRFLTMVRRSSCTPAASWILLRTSSSVTWSLFLIASHLKDIKEGR